ncbi:hypothetical protein [Actinoplanes regularis]|uniref:hypothetical protein n=1 Tax=Actinoplanes regularis TaxID=52697 RepID=UPI0024A0A8E4|nr:hypothetical protein [Actinoplanes regularis]GLW29332.1 hypothetical protein Areg01_22720 [Actinoplanes regularis]
MRGGRVGIALLVLLGSGALAACSNADGVDAGPAPAGTAPSLGPGKYAGDDPVRPTLPATRGPVLHMDNKYTYTVQVLDAMTTLSMPGEPPPAGTTALALLLRVEADPPNRRISPPIQYLGIDYPSREKDLSQYIGTVLEGRKSYLTEDQLLFGGEDAEGVDVLAANTVYYTRAWQLVSEKADLKGASLCEVAVAGRKNCIPIGAIRAG